MGRCMPLPFCVGPLAPPSPDIIPGYHWRHMVVRMVELGCQALRKEIWPPAMSWIRICWRALASSFPGFGAHNKLGRRPEPQHLDLLSTKRKQHSFDAHRISAPGQDLNIWMGPQARHIRSDGPSVRIQPEAMPELIGVPDCN